MWYMIKKLRNDNEDGKRIDLYEEGEVVDREAEKDKMMTFWKGVYQKKENKIREVWNEAERNNYARNWRG